VPSWQARALSALIRVYIRRRSWGDERALARRARRRFGALPSWGRWRTKGLRVERVDDGTRGRWVLPDEPHRGTILYIHGGGYVSCSAATHLPIAAALARYAERRVLSVDYRLAPEHRFPSALDDVVAAYRWLLKAGIDPGSIALAGDSAGGGLVLATLVRARDEGLPLPSCGVCFSPWTDLAGTGASVLGNAGRCAMFHPENIGDFARAYLAGASPREPYASPLFADLTGLPPVLLQVDSSELLLDDARGMHDRLRVSGGSSTLTVYDGTFHCWQMFDGVVPEAGTALRQAAAFINGP
jgi:monoterpene epsilon-lactone hydrolase